MAKDDPIIDTGLYFEPGQIATLRNLVLKEHAVNRNLSVKRNLSPVIREAVDAERANLEALAAILGISAETLKNNR